MGLDRGAVSARQLFFERFGNLETTAGKFTAEPPSHVQIIDLAQLPEVPHTPLKPSGFGSSVGNILICRRPGVAGLRIDPRSCRVPEAAGSRSDSGRFECGACRAETGP